MRALLLALALLLAGCASDAPADDEPASTDTSSPSPTTSSTTTTPPPSPTPEESCEPQVRQSGNQYEAYCTIQRNLSPGKAPDLTVRTANGGIVVGHGSDTGKVNLWARGTTEQAARDALEQMTVTIEPSAVSIHVEAPTWNNRGASVHVAFKGELVDTLDLATSNGGIQVDDFGGDEWELATSNGPVEVHGAADTMSIATSNNHVKVHGGTNVLTIATSNNEIRITGQHVDIDATTSNNQIVIDAAATASGRWDLQTSNGAIDIQVPEPSDTGYDVSLSTVNAGASIALKDTEPVGPQSNTAKHERTSDFASRAIQVVIDATTSNGRASVAGN